MKTVYLALALALCVPSAAFAACTDGGGYPWATGDCLYVEDLNAAIAGANPVLNAPSQVGKAIIGFTAGVPLFGPVAAATAQSTCVSIIAFGGHGDDAGDNTAAFNAAKIASNCVALPPGIFRFAGGISYDFISNTSSVTIKGEGQDVTVLHFPNATGTALNINMMGLSNSFHLRDFTVTTGTTNIDIGIKIVQNKTQVLPRHASGYANSDISRVTMRSDEGYWEQDLGSVTHGWKTGVRTEGVSVINFNEFTYYGPKPTSGGYAIAGGSGGTGISVAAAGNGTWLPVLFNFNHININWAEIGIVYGSYVQGFQMVGSNIVNCYIGLHVPPGATDLAQLAIQTSQFNNIKNVLIESQVPQIIITGNLLYTPSDQASITITKPVWQAQISSNAFAALSTHSGTGILLNPDGVDPVPATITGNSFWELAIAINLGANVDGSLVTGNTYRNNTLNVVNSSLSPYNIITGGTPTVDWAGTLPSWQLVSGATDNGTGKVRVTVSNAGGFFNGQLIIVGGLVGIVGVDGSKVIATTVNVIDATHLDLVNVNYSGAYTGGGMISSLPQ